MDRNRQPNTPKTLPMMLRTLPQTSTLSPTGRSVVRNGRRRSSPSAHGRRVLSGRQGEFYSIIGRYMST